MRRNLAAAVSATALLTASLLVGSASPAHAALTGCTAWHSYNTAYSKCTGGTGLQAIVAYGRHVNPQVGYVYIIGPSVGVGEVSKISFPGTLGGYYYSLMSG
ncbi:hypothetical protein HII36_28965 [Nonomuraea sp. NN258]|uniref:hypothetical protein n=1 Tax=Nonomuraea antri TaxID=2730852 RepID=UPI001569D72E|nr:hypothetical protein [Nonomuraea antri]NRQ35835.1 hypothetical protein [Nonomuraea antri]